MVAVAVVVEEVALGRRMLFWLAFVWLWACVDSDLVESAPFDSFDVP